MKPTHTLIYESRKGTHWRDTLLHRPLRRLSACDAFWFVIGHLLLLPFALLALVAGWIAIPFYFWSDGRRDAIRRYPRAVVDARENRNISLRIVRPEDDPRPPRVSVVIPFFNRRDEVEPCLNSVLSQELPDGLDVEVIAVDNGSDDGTLEALRKYPVRVVECAERGPAAARNAGIDAARGAIVAFTDSDCVVDPGWLARLVQPFDDPDMLFVGGNIETQFEDDHIATFTARNEILSNARFFQVSALFAPFVATANAAFRREEVVKVGGFDCSLRVSEDADLSWRVLDLGGKMAYIPDAVIYHAHRTTWRGFFRQAWDYGQGSAAVFAKHRKWLKADCAVSWTNIREMAYTPVGFLRKIDEPDLDPDFPESQTLPDHEWDDLDRSPEKYWFLWRTAFTTACILGSLKRGILFV